MAVLLENDMFTFWFWILVIGRYAIMFRFVTRFLALTVGSFFSILLASSLAKPDVLKRSLFIRFPAAFVSYNL